MHLLLQLRVTRCIALAGIIATFSMVDPASAGRGDQHPPAATGTVATDARSPRIRASSETYDLDGVLSNGILTLQIREKPSGLPVSSAELEVMIDGAAVRAIDKGDGVYTFQSATLDKKGTQEVIVSLKHGSKSDLLIGVLAPEDTATGNKGHAHDDHDHPLDAGKTKGSKAHDHAAHDGHGRKGHGEEGTVRLTPQVMREFGVATEKAGPGAIADIIARPAEVTFNMDRFSHVVPHVAGIVRSVNAAQGDVVTANQVLAIIESRELAEAKSAYLAALERLELAKSEFERAEELRNKNITSEKSYLTSRSAYAEARIAMRSARQKLGSIGVSDVVLEQLAKEPDAILTHYELRARIGGTVVKRHLVHGEAVPSDREAFTVADLSTVWVNISLYSADLAKVAPGQQVRLETDTGQATSATISFVSPDVSETTRTATARVVLAGTAQTFRPGMFIKASIEIGHKDAGIRVASAAIQRIEEKDVVFTREGEVFKPRPVMIGRRNGQYVEIVRGLRVGDEIATKGSFLIKSELGKSSFDDGHNH